MVPRFRRANSQLKMKVRALPTWRKPVGDGAKRTRKFPWDDELAGTDMIELPMVRAAKSCRQARL
jgi:ribosomal protein L32E